MSSFLSNSATVIASKDQVWRELDGEAIVLNLETGVYYGLDPVGARIWSLLQEPIRVEQICQKLLDEYDVERTACQEDLLALLKGMADSGLIQVTV
jgi:hypothetical protein